MADSEKKQVMLVVEGTTALAPYWPTILNDRLNNLIRSFFDNGSSSSEDNDDAMSLNNVEFALVVFNGSSSSPWLLHQSKWTTDANCVMKWLSTIDFSSGGAFSDAATTVEGLHHALIMFSLSNKRSPNHHLLQRHCILVAACNPDSSLSFFDVVKLFQQSNVSLSAIYASQIPQFRVICNAIQGNDNPRVETVTQSLHHMSLNSSWNSEMRSIAAADLGPAYVHVWEKPLALLLMIAGRLICKEAFLNYQITYLHAFMLSVAPKFVEDWPTTIQFEFIGRTNMEYWKEKFDGKSNDVVFHTTNVALGNMHKENLIGVIKLPSQLMVFIATDNPSRFLGFILDETPEQQEITLKRWKHQWNPIKKRSFESQTPEQRQENPV